MDTIHSEIVNVLFVDDETNVLRSLRRLFFRQGYRIFTATSGLQGLEIVKDNEIAVVVSDEGMPRMIGTEFLERVRAISSDTIRIILTGHTDVSAAIDALHKGDVHQYIMKPWNNDDLILSVRTATERYRKGRARGRPVSE